MTQLDRARAGEITDQLAAAALRENLENEHVRQTVAAGVVVLPVNARRLEMERPVLIGQGTLVKVNANLGTSSDHPELAAELEKLRVALESGADTVMDLSTGGDIDGIRRAIVGACTVPLGTVPIYQAVIEAVRKRGCLANMTADGLFEVIERHARDGVDFVTVHCGVTRGAVERLREQGRVTDVVSRGGAFLTEWMILNEVENPLYEHFDRLLELAHEYDVTLSLGDGLRPGSIADATDRAQVQELVVLGELRDRAVRAGVQVMIEGPGHVPLDQVEANVLMEKKLCGGAPFYVLGPLVTDVAPGYDHIACAIGGAVAGAAGADFLCYVTPSEHLHLPGPHEVREGVMAARVAAHAADVARGNAGALAWDRRMSEARKALDWESQIELAIDPERARAMWERSGSPDSETCTMCGEYCAILKVKEYFAKKT
jgi:phosphomethylpyrimidine synthase